MTLARVIGAMVCTVKNEHYEGEKLLFVQPVSPSGDPTGKAFLAVDAVQAGVGDLVVVFDEGGSSRQLIKNGKAMTIRTSVGAIVDAVEIEDPE